MSAKRASCPVRERRETSVLQRETPRKTLRPTRHRPAVHRVLVISVDLRTISRDLGFVDFGCGLTEMARRLSHGSCWRKSGPATLLRHEITLVGRNYV
jgi:hypothetical protein